MNYEINSDESEDFMLEEFPDDTFGSGREEVLAFINGSERFASHFTRVESKGSCRVDDSEVTLETMPRAVDVVFPHHIAEMEGLFGVAVPSPVICRLAAEAASDPDIASWLTGLADALPVRSGLTVCDPRPQMAAEKALWNDVFTEVSRPGSGISVTGVNFASFMARTTSQEYDPGILYSRVELMLPGCRKKVGHPSAIDMPIRDALLEMARTGVGGYDPALLRKLVDRYYPVEPDDLELVDAQGRSIVLYDVRPVLGRQVNLADYPIPAGSVHLEHEDVSKCAFSTDPLMFRYKVFVRVEPEDGFGDIPDAVLVAETHSHFASVALAD